MWYFTLVNTILWLVIVLFTLIAEAPDTKENKIIEGIIQCIGAVIIIWGFKIILWS